MVRLITTFIIAISIALLINGCDATLPEQLEEGESMIQIHNSSSRIMEDIRISFPDVNLQFGTLSPNETSVPKRAENIYSTPYVEAVVRGDTVIVQPIDYVGEDPLEPGEYTLELFLNENLFNSDDSLAVRYSLLFDLKKEG